MFAKDGDVDAGTLIIALAIAFGSCYIYSEREPDFPVALIRSFYTAIVERPLHIHGDESMTAFIVPAMRYCRAHIHDRQYPTPQLLFWCRSQVENLLRMRGLSAEELDAIKGYYELWLRCVISACLRLTPTQLND